MSVIEHPELTCPECGVVTVRWIPVFVKGREWTLEYGLTMQEPDHVGGWLLEPCGHRVKGLRVFYDDVLSRSVVEFERFDPS